MDEYSAETLAKQYTRGTAIAAVVIAGGWHLAYNLTAQLVSWPTYRWPLLSLAGWLAYSVGVAVCARDILGGPGTVRRPALMVGVALAVSLAVGIASRGEIMRYPGWAFGSVMWLAILALWGRPLTLLLGFFAVNAVLNAVLMASIGPHDQVSIARYLVATYGAGAIELGFAFGARALTGAAAWAVDAAAKKSEEDTARQEADEVHRTRQERYQALGHTATPVLARLADGSGNPTDPALQRRCAAAASRLRRLIAETDDRPDPLVHELRACADIAERRGVIVDLIAVGTVPDMPRAVRRALSELPIEVLAATHTYARITLAGAAGQVAVGVVADADLDAVPEDVSSGVDVETSCHREGDQLWAQTQWRHRSPLR